MPEVKDIEGTHTGSPPAWWCHKGFQMVPDEYQGSSEICIRNGNVAHVKIRSYREEDGSRYLVEWYVLHEFRGSPEANLYSTGRCDMSKAELRDAFNRERDQSKLHLSPGKYERCGQYLSIPGRGHGQQGDPNVSLLVSEQVEDYVAGFVRFVTPRA